MNSIGKTIQCLRKAKGVTQEKMAQQIGVSFQSISKWENESTMPDIMLLPVIADYFCVSIDELFQYKWNALTSKERLVRFMLSNGMIISNGKSYCIYTERFTTNLQLNAIGEAFAERLLETHVCFDAIMGLAYHGIGFAAATAMALQNRYGHTTHFFYDRKQPDSRGNILCGYTPTDGDRFVLIDDVLQTGEEIIKRVTRLRSVAKIELATVIVVAQGQGSVNGRKRIEDTYGIQVHSLLNDEDIQAVMRKR